jgi:hypothetical protein
MLIPREHWIVRPSRPGTLSLGSASSVSCTSCLRARARARRSPFLRISAPGSHPSRDASQPTSSSPLTADSGWWRIVTASMSPSAGRHMSGSKVEAIRSRHGALRSQARSTT